MTRLCNLLSLALAAAALAASLGAPAQAGERPRAVVELFTSQGCSSCPPADAKLAELVHEPGIVAITLPVDYWDYLGWKDTLAKPEHTARQKAYAAVRGDRGVYTPQIIVNCHVACVGSNAAEVEEALAARSAPLPVAVEISAGAGRVAVEVGAGDGRADVWLLAVQRSRTVDIARGENRGRTASYANVVQAVVRIGEWVGESARFEQENPPPADFYVALVQRGEAGKPGPILGAAQNAR